MKINLNSPLLRGRKGKNKATSKSFQEAVRKKVEANENSFKYADQIERLRKMKNSEAFTAKLDMVEKALIEGELHRSTDKKGKNMTKTEVNQLHGVLKERERQERIKEISKTIPDNFITIRTPNDYNAFREAMQKAIREGAITGFDIETFGEEKGDALDPHRGSIAGFSWSYDGINYYLPLQHEEEVPMYKVFTPNGVMENLREDLERVKTVMHNAPFDCKWLKIHYGIDMATNLEADVRVMAFMLNNEERSFALKYLTQHWLKSEADFFDELFPNTDAFNEVPLDVATFYAAGDTEKTLRLFHYIEDIWKDPKYSMTKVRDLFYEVEMPVMRIFIDSDVTGITIDTELAEQLYQELTVKLEDIQKKVEELYGQEINLNSPKQIQEMLYDHFALPDRTKGWNRKRSTDKEALEALEDDHEVVRLIQQYRSESKLRSSYTRSLVEKTVDGKVHPWHNTIGAVTGRFTCQNPNTQQIPSRRTEFRKIFKASEGKILIAMDYSQIELRVLAHDANEHILIDAFHNGKDIHSTTGQMISDMTYDEIMAEKDVEGSKAESVRDNAKTVNFGIVYGMGAYSLAKRIKTTEDEAEEIIAGYFKGYPGISDYMDMKKREAQLHGYVTDMFGRVRSFHKAMKGSKGEQKGALRAVGNFPIQSGAGVILKKAIIDLQPVLEKHDSKILLQVHDELVFECPEDISEEAVTEIREVLENVVELKVPLVADVDIYPERWAERVDYDEWFGKGDDSNA